MKRTHQLSPKEKYILEERGTEAPGSGVLLQEKGLGVYLCKKCDAPLYLSLAKFDSHCGWPSFDEELPDAILRRPDGNRTEICCKCCQGHLGHVFTQEQLTAKNTRHCVNSLSLRFVSALDEEGWPKAIFGAGCFWEVQHKFAKLPGVRKTQVGYMGGQITYPTYEEVCEGSSNHTEVLELSFDPSILTYQELLAFFFTFPQKPQKAQYSPTIFYLTDSQRLAALQYKEALENKQHASLATRIAPASLFYKAEDYHQNYLN